jgi:hypothetical protein
VRPRSTTRSTWPARIAKTLDTSCIEYTGERYTFDSRIGYPLKEYISIVNHPKVAAQQALAADVASRPRDQGYFESCNQPECLPDLECAAAEAQDVGPQHQRHQPLTTHLLPPSATVYYIQRVCQSLDQPSHQFFAQQDITRGAAWHNTLGLTQLRACAPTSLAQTRPTASWVQPEIAGWPGE